MPPTSRRKAPPPAPEAAAPGDLWHTGMGALAKAQAQSSKALGTLMQQSLALQSHTQALAREQLSQAAQAISAATPAAAGWNPLESVFEQRVARALNQLGLPDPATLSATLTAMQTRIETLEQALARLSESESPGKKANQAPSANAASAAPTAAAPRKRTRRAAS